MPLLPLDGGHVAAAFYEAVRRAFARLRGRPDPGPVDTARLLPVAYVVGGIILISGVVLILADIFDPIQLFLTFPFSWWVGCAAEVVVAGGCADDDLAWSGVEAAVDEFDVPARHFADQVAAGACAAAIL